MILDVIIAFSCGVAGIACGWVMHSLHVLTEARKQDHNREVATKPVAVESAAVRLVAETVSIEKVTEVAERLRAFAFRMVDDVDVHQSTIEHANSVFQTSDMGDSQPAMVEAVDQLVTANETMRRQLDAAQSQIREQTTRLASAEQRAATDALTQISNRGAFDRELLARHRRGPSTAGILALLDVDHFKKFNDTNGHPAGDEALRVVASVLESRLRDHGFVGRFGGEEFAIVLRTNDIDEGAAIIEKARLAIGGRTIRFGGQMLHVTASIGIGKLQEGHSVQRWLQSVDEALYHSKQSGRDCSHIHSGDKMIRVGHASPSDETKLSDPLEKDIDALAQEASALAAEAEVATRAAAPSVEIPRTISLDTLKGVLADETPLPPPKTLCYLPDRAVIMQMMHALTGRPSRSGLPHQLMAVRLSGRPSGATMRSLLQLVRSATRGNDRIGCIDASTLLICMPEIESKLAQSRAELMCSGVAAIGLSLASGDKRSTGEFLSIGILELEALDADSELISSRLGMMIDGAIAMAILAGQQPSSQSKFPVLARSLGTAPVA